MAEIIAFKKEKLSQRPNRNTLCRNGHHEWKVNNKRVFDVKNGKLVTVYSCLWYKKRKFKLI